MAIDATLMHYLITRTMYDSIGGPVIGHSKPGFDTAFFERMQPFPLRGGEVRKGG